MITLDKTKEIVELLNELDLNHCPLYTNEAVAKLTNTSLEIVTAIDYAIHPHWYE